MPYNSYISAPHLTTALTGPLQLLERHVLDNQVKIETWLRHEWRKTPSPVYGSVDLRNAGFKLAPVDMNLFPAGFNNLNPDFMPLCIQAAQDTFEKCDSNITKILLIPESHTRNLFYLESLCTLQEIILKAGFDVRIGSLIPDLKASKDVFLPSGRKICLEPVQRKANRIGLNDFDPCFILLNNDLSNGIPDVLKDIEQPIYPPMRLGWSQRLKSNHFAYYKSVAEEFSKCVDIDPWLISPLFRYSTGVDFLKREGMENLREKSEKLLSEIQKKYDEYNIRQKPFIVIKADAGTYGMSVMMLSNVDELERLNRKQRTRMTASKGGGAVTRVILQEGVYTFETIGKQESVAEPVVYMIGHHVVGGFYRVHKNRGPTENLNAPGMHFEPLAFAKCCNVPDLYIKKESCDNRFYAYGVIARLSLLAAAREQKEGIV